MQEATKRPEIFEYWDHIQILNDLFAYKKKINPRISLEMVARDSRTIKRPLLSLILAGKRTLKEDKIVPLCRALGMTKQENQFFYSLVQFNQCKNPNKTSQYLADVLSRKPIKPSLEGDRKALLAKWYYVPLLEFLKIPGFRAEPKWIEQRFRRKISSSEIQESLQLFQDLKLVSLENGLWKINERTLLSSQDIPSKAIQAYHHSMLDISKSALMELPVGEREFLGVTFPVSKTEAQEIKEELRKLCQKIVLNRPPDATFDEVASLNIQFYFLTKNQGD